MVTVAGTCNVAGFELVKATTMPFGSRGKLFTDTVPPIDCPPTTDGNENVTAETPTTGAGLSVTEVVMVWPFNVAVIGTVVVVVTDVVVTAKP